MPLFPTKYATESKVNLKMLAFYTARARGGVGLIVLDCPCLDFPRAYKGPQELRFDLEEYADGLRELIVAIHAQGAKAFMHLNYPKERFLKEEIPGAKKKGEGWVIPLANTMSPEEADEILEIMAAGAGRAKEIGYDGVEIQASYGDLIAQLLSPLLNKREDEMGGSTENRSRFLTRLIQRVKASAGLDFPVMVKLVCHEFVTDGLDIDEGVEIARLAEKAGADGILANAGNKATKFMTIPTHESPPGPLVDLASRVKGVVKIPVISIGKINAPNLAETIIAQGKADFVAMARALIADPELPEKAEAGMLEEIRGCVYCLEDCAGKGAPGVGRCCTVNPFAGLEYALTVAPAPTKKKVLVVGGGPAGIQAALMSSLRGHQVELWEQTHELGGQARLMSLAPFKEEMAEALRYLKHSIRKSDVQVRLHQKGDVSTVLAFGPDAVIVATGSRPARPLIPGIDSDLCVDAREVYEGKQVSGRKIVIIGGGDIGCETADWLADPDRQITVVEMLPQVLTKMKKVPKERLLSRLSEKRVNILTEAEAVSLKSDGVLVKKKGEEPVLLEADRVIFATDAEQEDSLFKALAGKIKEIVTVGDAASPGDLGSALRSATRVALEI